MADQGRQGDFLQLVTVLQNGVVAINNLTQTMSAIFPTGFVTVPANSTASGTIGSFAVDSSHLYVAIGANSWLRFNGTTF